MSRFRFLSRLVCGLALAVGLSVAAPAPAQVAAPVVAPAAPLDAKTIQDNFERFRPVLKQVEDSLAALVNPTDEDFFRLRGQVMEVSDGLQAISKDIDPRAAELKQRLAQLGPVPTEAGVTESDEVRTERTSLTSSLAKLEELQKITAALTVQAQQVLSKITEQRRSHFTRSILQRTDSALSPTLWGAFIDALPDDIRVSRNVLGLWWHNLADAYNSSFIGPVPMLPVVLLLGVGFGFMLYLARRHYKRVWVNRDPAVTDPPMRRRIFASVRLMVVDLVPMTLFLWGILFVARALHLNPVVFQGIFQAFLGALLLYFIARTLNDALVAPREPAWRIAVFDEIAVQRLYWFSNTLYVWIAFKIVLDAFLKAISASIPLTSVANAMFAFLTAGMVLPILRIPRTSGEEREKAKTDETPPAGKAERLETPADKKDFSTITQALRAMGWVAVALVFISLIIGYISFASFLVQESGSVILILGFTYFMLLLVDEVICGTFWEDNETGRIIQSNLGIQMKSLEQIGVIAAGIIKFMVILASFNILLARMRIDSTDIAGQLRTAFFGFTIGDVSFSLSSLLTGIIILIIGISITRMIRNWLKNTYFPVTNLDAGLQNSILTITHYFGTGITLVLACSSIGLSLEKIAIVAGALSVGIGFGLQSIVNNFVSGLILLWERPIRVGDWVKVGSDEGYVRNIKVRATEIQTFDRATVIVPNSNLISGTVVNNVRLTRMRRVSLTIILPYYADADKAAEIMRQCAFAHMEVMSQPPVAVYFKNITETTIELLLICYVDDVDSASRVDSELRFAIFRELRAAGLLPTSAVSTTVVLQTPSGDTASQPPAPQPENPPGNS